MYSSYSLDRLVSHGVDEETQSLNNLQITLFNGHFKCILDNGDTTLAEKGKLLALRIMKGDQTIFNDDSLFDHKWKEYKYQVVVTPLVETVTNASDFGNDETDGASDSIKMHLKLTLLHIIVLSRDRNILQNFIDKFKDGDCKSPDFWMDEPVHLENKRTFDNHNGITIKIAEEEVWIDGANCYHLTAKFNPRALFILLNLLGKDSKSAMKEIFMADTPSPLHVAAFNSDSISTW